MSESFPLHEELELVSRQRDLIAEESKRFEDALRQIADHESGIWGEIARRALRPGREPVGGTD